MEQLPKSFLVELLMKKLKESRKIVEVALI